VLHYRLVQTPIAALVLWLAASGPSVAQPNSEPHDKGVAVFAAGDIADCRRVSADASGAAATAVLVGEHLSSNPRAAVLTLGDHTYPLGNLSEFLECYEPTWGRFKQRTYPSPGNHEYYTPLAGGYYAYFGESAGPDRRGYYSFRIGSWHVVSLNSNLRPHQHAEQIDWLKEDLALNPTRCTLAYWHHARFSSGGHGSNTHMQDAWEVLQAAGAELVLSAHDHGYERFAPQDARGDHDERHGMRQFVIGTGGAGLTSFRRARPNSEVRDNATHGVLRLQLKDDGYDWEFLAVAPDRFVDHGSAPCK
jgi:acid phosphatase type 7